MLYKRFGMTLEFGSGPMFGSTLNEPSPIQGLCKIFWRLWRVFTEVECPDALAARQCCQR